MTQRRTITSQEMRSINRSAIVEMIRRSGPISRAEIAANLQVSLPTVMRIVDDLVADDWVRPRPSPQWTGGRRRSLLEFNAEGQVVIGIDLGGTRIFGAVADLGGKIVEEANVDREGAGGEACYRLLVDLIRTLLASPAIQERKIRGIGVGAPGVTEHREGIVKWAHSLKWRGYPLKAKLEASFPLPIIVDNDVNLGALGELWFGAGQNTQNMILVTVGTGIGAGIIIDGVLFRGAHEASGEIGHMIPGREFLRGSHVEFGALESVASGIGIAARARGATRERRKGMSRRPLSAEDVFEAARGEQIWACRVVDETVDYLTIAIANLAVSFDPEVIVLGGSVTRAADLLLDPIRKGMEGMIPTPPRVEVSPLGRRAAVMGAITNVLHNTDDYYQIRKLS